MVALQLQTSVAYLFHHLDKNVTPHPLSSPAVLQLQLMISTSDATSEFEGQVESFLLFLDLLQISIYADSVSLY
jgi:hypothetical protein